MSQNAQPIADSSMTDLWTPNSGGVCYAMLNELAADGDTSFIAATITSGTSLETIPACKLSACTDPQVDTGFSTQYWVRKVAGTNWTASFALYQGDPNAGGSLLDSWTALITTTSYTLRTRNHSDAVCASISDYSNLYLAIGGSSTGSSVCRVTFVDLVLPDAPSTKRRIRTGAGL